MTAPLTERQRELVKHANETVSLTAAATAAGMRGVDLNSREAVYQAAYGHTKDQLAGLLVIIDELLAAAAEAGTFLTVQLVALADWLAERLDDPGYDQPLLVESGITQLRELAALARDGAS